VGIALLCAWFSTITHPDPNALLANNHGSTSSRTGEKENPQLVFVGKVSGMVDCQWADDATATYAGAGVALGRRYALKSGLMELTYSSGAKVILQGPCDYTVESARGGFLQVGKLVARVGAGGAGQGTGTSGQGPVASGQKAESRKRKADSLATSHSPLATNSNPQSLIPNPLFSVRTPTALVEDLGTEFGVEVADNGKTTSHVFQGRVVMRVAGQGNEKPESPNSRNSESRTTPNPEIVLSAGQAACVALDDDRPAAVAFEPEHFARVLKSSNESPTEVAYRKAILADRPMAYWPLNEPAGTRLFHDRSGNGYHGVAMDNVIAGQAGPLGAQSRAVELKGDGYIDVGRQDRFAFRNNFTIEAWLWINPEWNSAEENQPGSIFSAGSGERRYQQHGWGLMCRPQSVVIKGGDENQRILSFVCYSLGFMSIPDYSMPLRRWTHAALVYNSDHSAQAFIDGKATMVMENCLIPKQGPVWVSLGWNSNMGGQYWKGRLAHIAVYPHALQKNQILEHYRIAISCLDEYQGKEGNTSTTGR
jgi:hypothetical protein